MGLKGREKFKFIFDDNDQLNGNTVIHFEGNEALSECWNIQIILQYEVPDLKKDNKFNLKQLLNQNGIFKMLTDDTPVTYSGRIIEAELKNYLASEPDADYTGGFCFVKITFVPELYTLKYFTRNRTFLDMDIKVLLKKVIGTNSSIKANFSFSKEYKNNPVMAQQEESDFTFLNRIISQYGIFYYFENNDNGDYQVVFRDSNNTDDDAYEYKHNDDSGQISDIIAKMKSVPKNVRIRDYNSDLKDGIIDETFNQNKEVIDFINENVESSEEAKTLASIRYDQMVKDMLSFEFKSNLRPLLSGSFLELDNIFNNKLMIVKRSFIGNQKTRESTSGGYSGPTFISQITAVFSDVCYRPKINNDLPITGLASAKVCTSDAMYEKTEPTEVTTPSSPINSEGKYNIWFRDSDVISDTNTPVDSPFSVREIIPYAGSDRGFQMPLQIGDEVLLNMDNKPVIHGAVNNREGKDIYNKKEYSIKTSGKNYFTLDDDELSGIKMGSPAFNSSVEIGDIDTDTALKLKSDRGILITGKGEHFEVEAEFHLNIGNDLILREGAFQKILLGFGTKVIIGITINLNLALTFDFKSLHFEYFGHKANIVGAKNNDHGEETRLTGAEEKLVDSKIKAALNKNAATMQRLDAINDAIKMNMFNAKCSLSSAKVTAKRIRADITKSNKCVTKIKAHADSYDTCVVKSEEKMVKQGVRGVKREIKALESKTGELSSTVSAFRKLGAI